MNKMRKLVSGALGMALVGGVMAGASGCQSSAPGAECHSSTNFPGGVKEQATANVGGLVVVDVAGSGPLILGIVWAWCVNTPQSHTLTVYIQKYVGVGEVGADQDGWLTVAYRAGQAAPTGGADPIPFTSSVTCSEGKWRLEWDVLGMSSTGDPFTGDQLSDPITLSAGDCQGAGFGLNNEPPDEGTGWEETGE